MKYRAHGVTEWLDEHENDANHLQSAALNQIEYLRFWNNVLDSALHHHDQNNK